MNDPTHRGTSILDDLESVQRALDGDTQLYHQLLEAIYDDIARFSKSRIPRMVRQDVAPHDIASDTCVSFAERSRKPGFRLHSPRKYVRRIAQNCITDAIRERDGLIRKQLAGSSDFFEAVAGSDQSPNALILTREKKEHVESALASLPPIASEILNLRYREHLPWKVVAERVGLSESHAGAIKRNAILAVRHQLVSAGVLTPPPDHDRRA